MNAATFCINCIMFKIIILYFSILQLNTVNAEVCSYFIYFYGFHKFYFPVLAVLCFLVIISDYLSLPNTVKV